MSRLSNTTLLRAALLPTRLPGIPAAGRVRQLPVAAARGLRIRAAALRTVRQRQLPAPPALQQRRRDSRCRPGPGLLPAKSPHASPSSAHHRARPAARPAQRCPARRAAAPSPEGDVHVDDDALGAQPADRHRRHVVASRGAQVAGGRPSGPARRRARGPVPGGVRVERCPARRRGRPRQDTPVRRHGGRRTSGRAPRLARAAAQAPRRAVAARRRRSRAPRTHPPCTRDAVARGHHPPRFVVFAALATNRDHRTWERPETFDPPCGCSRTPCATTFRRRTSASTQPRCRCGRRAASSSTPCVRTRRSREPDGRTVPPACRT